MPGPTVDYTILGILLADQHHVFIAAPTRPHLPPPWIALPLLALVLALALALATPSADAADNQKTVKTGGLGGPIQAEIDRLQQADSTDTDAALAMKLNRQALGFVQQADENRARTGEYHRVIDTAAEKKALQKKLDALPDPDKTLKKANRTWQRASFDTLKSDLTRHQAAAAEAQSHVAELQNQLETIQTHPDQRGKDLAATKARQAELHGQIAQQPADDSNNSVSRAVVRRCRPKPTPSRPDSKCCVWRASANPTARRSPTWRSSYSGHN